MADRRSLYRQTVELTEEYLGPAGERFVQRQISSHLGIEPEKLDKKNLSKLIDWSGIAFAMITKDSHDVESYKQELKQLTSK